MMTKTNIGYNTFSFMEELPYNIIKRLLINGSENFWKILYYDTPNALQKDNLSMSQKKSLVFDGSNDENDCRVFLKPLVQDAIIEAKSIIKLYLYQEVPTNKVSSIISIRFETITDTNIDMVYNENNVLCNRVSLLNRMLLQELNGSDIGGSGLLSFDRELTRNCTGSYAINNVKNFYGDTLVMGVNFTSASNGSNCHE